MSFTFGLFFGQKLENIGICVVFVEQDDVSIILVCSSLRSIGDPESPGGGGGGEGETLFLPFPNEKKEGGGAPSKV